MTDEIEVFAQEDIFGGDRVEFVTPERYKEIIEGEDGKS